MLLPWLNGRLDLRQAYMFSYANIIALLQDIVRWPAVYGVPAENVNMLASIHQRIDQLRQPNGPSYLVPPPPQSIDRRANPRWPHSISELRLNKSTCHGVDYWALPDCLGLFLSSLGRAPAGASKRNFYLPLLSGEIRQKPRVYQCTWTPAGEFHLGASRGGWSVRRGIGSWLAVLDRARFGIIKSAVLELTNWSQAWTPTIARRGKKAGKPFGRCAETYPFRKLLMGKPKEVAEQVCGLALSNKYIYTAPSVWDPCPNCEVLIEIHKGKISNFDRWTECVGAPP
ncbi:hypothetical protein BO82DRAFT_370985 [Aspergillus uvarum CBS 121591]|uniref:Uncharacterized protein n=1 Tax=Aspergillus uvarum CBS 121591 TaxID=1448315 RepID=A0A319CKE2_9EURO|nr:hypothetical protein BO82DRAFT_370985 [Aspergillus uvarum CBS 121591]PYH86046.1 hypothetical protein BO82DRAFT_370985 [Aspergillus uvarum CBS 121591]